MEVLEKREYQTEAPGVVVESLRQTMQALIVMATGLGKTITCGLTIKKYFENVNSYRVLYLCDRNLALNQAERAFLEQLDMKVSSARLYGSNEVTATKHGKKIVFASFQKLGSAREWYRQFSQDHFDLIVVDEAHHAFAPTYHSIIKYFLCGKCPIVGMTATPYRSDQKDIKSLFGPPVVDISLEEGIAMGWLADLEYQILSDDLDEDKLQRVIDREVPEGHKRRIRSFKALNQILFIRKRDDEIVKHIKLHTPKGRKTLIFCQSIAQADWLLTLLGPAARAFHSSKDQNENDVSLEEFKTGPIKYLLVVDKLNEAFDMPEVEVVVFLRSTDSKRIFFQQLGRGLRKTRTKRKVLVLDFVANCERLIYLATLANNVKKFSAQALQRDEMSNAVMLTNHDSEEYNVELSAEETASNFDVFIQADQETVRRPESKKKEQIFLEIEGKNFSFSFTHKIVKMMELLRVIREGWYSTWQEASKVAIEAGVKSSKDYEERYFKIDPRLPSSPMVFYDEPELDWDVFLQRKTPLEGWKKVQVIKQESCSTTAGYIIKKFAEGFKEKHPDWFAVFTENGVTSEHYHPDLVSKIVSEFGGREHAPEGWKTPATLSREIYGVGWDTIKDFANSFKEKHPDWFKLYINKAAYIEHYHPTLVGKIVSEFGTRKNPPQGWMTAKMIADECSVPLSAVLVKANNYRDANPKWFHDYHFLGNEMEFFHPDLIAKISIDVKGISFPPKGWSTIYGINREHTGGQKFITKESEKHRDQHPEWFKDYWVNGEMKEHLSPELVKLIKKRIKASKATAPKGWETPFQIASGFGEGVKWTRVEKIANQYREKHPEWFIEYRLVNRLREHYHPKLIAIIKPELEKVLIPIPKGWMTANQLAHLPNVANNHAYIKRFAEEYRQAHPEWFKEYFLKNDFQEHYHPDLVGMVVKKFKKK